MDRLARRLSAEQVWVAIRACYPDQVQLMALAFSLPAIGLGCRNPWHVPLTFASIGERLRSPAGGAPMSLELSETCRAPRCSAWFGQLGVVTAHSQGER